MEEFLESFWHEEVPREPEKYWLDSVLASVWARHGHERPWTLMMCWRQQRSEGQEWAVILINMLCSGRNDISIDEKLKHQFVV